MNPQITAGGTILVVDDTPSNIKVLFDFLNHAGFIVLVAEDGETALEQVQQVHPDLILLDVMMPGIDGFETCRRLKQRETTRNIPVIFLTAQADTRSKVEGLEAGGVDYITKPLQHEEVLARVNTHLTIQSLQLSLQKQNSVLRQEIEAHRRSQATVSYLNKELKTQQPIGKMFAKSAAMQNALKIVKQVSPTDSTVLIEGEIGCGKKLFAHAIHNSSRHNSQSLVKVDCASLRNDQTENEFFGVEASSLESSGLKTIGYLELAQGGTLFLNEIAELPAAFQAMLLRTIQDQQGRAESDTTIENGIRIIASTNRNLKQAVEKGIFREDLFYWLNVVPLRVPPLRERKADIPPLVDYFFNKHRMKLGIRVNKIEEDTISRLIAYHWPGNVRELENVIERALILSEGSILEIDESTLNQEAKRLKKQITPSDSNSTESFGADILPGSAVGDEKLSGKTYLTQIETDADPPDIIEKSGSHHDFSQDDFATAVKSALQHYVETDCLQQSPLLFSNSVNANIGTAANRGERTECLRTLILEATASLAKHPKSEIYARILHRTYYQPARSQELAADLLGLSYSTFRRHLVKARSWLIAELWQMELCYKK